MVAYACAIENGDAHLKNFSVIYENADAPISLAPAYDLVSTTPYQARDTLALTLHGTKQFPDRKTLLGFVRTITGRNEKSAAQLVDQAIYGARAASKIAKQYREKHPDAKRFSEVMIEGISRGISRLN